MSDEPDYTETRTEEASLTVTQIKETTGYLIQRRSLVNNDSTSMEVNTFGELVDLKYTIDDMVRLEMNRMLEPNDEQKSDT